MLLRGDADTANIYKRSAGLRGYLEITQANLDGRIDLALSCCGRCGFTLAVLPSEGLGQGSAYGVAIALAGRGTACSIPHDHSQLGSTEGRVWCSAKLTILIISLPLLLATIRGDTFVVFRFFLDNAGTERNCGTSNDDDSRNVVFLYHVILTRCKVCIFLIVARATAFHTGGIEMAEILVVTDNARIMRDFLKLSEWKETESPTMLVATVPAEQVRHLPFDFWQHCHLHNITCGFRDTQTRIKAVFFDMDRTVVREESIVELAKIADKKEEIARLTEQGMAGILSYREVYDRRIKMLSVVSEKKMSALHHDLRFNEGIRETLNELKKNNIKVFLISSGFYPVVKEVCKVLEFDDCEGSHVKFDEGYLTAEGEHVIIDGEGKRAWVESKCRELNISAQDEIAVVGDGANDMHMMQVAAVAIGFEPRAVLLQYVNALNLCGDHRFLIPLLTDVKE